MRRALALTATAGVVVGWLAGRHTERVAWAREDHLAHETLAEALDMSPESLADAIDAAWERARAQVPLHPWPEVFAFDPKGEVQWGVPETPTAAARTEHAAEYADLLGRSRTSWAASDVEALEPYMERMQHLTRTLAEVTYHGTFPQAVPEPEPEDDVATADAELRAAATEDDERAQDTLRKAYE